MRLPRSILAAIASPAIPIAGLGLPLVVYLPPFYADANTLGLGLTAVSAVFFVARIFDIAIDPVFGVLADKLRVPLGRRKFWLLLSLPIIVLATWKIFMPAPGVGTSYLLAWVLVLYVGYTMITISIVSWSAELSTDYNERTRVQAWYQTTLMIGLVTVLIVPVVVERGFHGDAWAKMAGIGWFIIALVIPSVLLAVTRVPEVPVREDLSSHWRDAAAALLRSRPLRFVVGADFMFGLATGVAGAVYVFAIRDGLGIRGGGENIILLIYFVVGCVFAPVWALLGRRWEKHKVLVCAALYSIAAPFLFFLVPQGSFVMAAIVTALFGIPYAAARLLLKSMMADVTDDDRLQTGRMQAGIFFSLFLTTEKLGVAIALLSYVVLDGVGFVAGSTSNSPGALTALLLLFAAAPAIFHALAAWILLRYPITRARQEAMRAQIAARFGE
jgi:Na+/melibiose symporter-like transporter